MQQRLGTRGGDFEGDSDQAASVQGFAILYSLAWDCAIVGSRGVTMTAKLAMMHEEFIVRLVTQCKTWQSSTDRIIGIIG